MQTSYGNTCFRLAEAFEAGKGKKMKNLLFGIKMGAWVESNCK